MSVEANFVEECLRAHNEYRRRHGVPDLVLSKTLCTFSEGWARTIAARGAMQHSQGSGYGENIYGAWSSNQNFRVKGQEVVDSWYNEIKDYTFGREPNGGRVTGHFSQVVWKTSRELGIGFARSPSSGYVYVVANYSPPGNYVGQHAAHVPPVGGFPGERRPSPVVAVQDDSSEASEASDSDDASESSGDDNDFERQGLELHNEYRKRHGVPPLKINSEMTKYAQEWADHLARINVCQHRENGKYGANIHFVTGSVADFTVTARDACENWYSSSKDYNYGCEPASLEKGSFTSMIWKNTTELGMAMARFDKRVVVVANYNPWGNYIGQHIQNCPAPIENASAKKFESKKTKAPKVKITPDNSSNSSDTDEASDDASEFEKVGLKSHNDYRRIHGVPLLKLNPELTKYAQEWGDYLVSNNLFQHRVNGKYAENLYIMKGFGEKFNITAKDACDMWYAEIKDYQFGQEPTTMKAGHFTAMIWKNCTDLGMAISNSSSRAIIVATYHPWPNVTGHYTANIPRPIKPDDTRKNNVAKRGTREVDKTSSNDSSVVSEYGSEFEKEGLRVHNEYRRRHGVPPLKLSPEVSRYAQEWANYLASNNMWQHRQNGKYGENLYAMSGTSSNYPVSAKDACNLWYAEIKDFYFGYEPATLAAGHFTAMIWKNSTELGIAMARSNNRVVIVANYNPWGNVTGQYTANCPPLV